MGKHVQLVFHAAQRLPLPKVHYGQGRLLKAMYMEEVHKNNERNAHESIEFTLNALIVDIHTDLQTVKQSIRYL